LASTNLPHRYNGEYYKMSLRMMKLIWKHIRLRKGFVNMYWHMLAYTRLY
jgi:hypothetical protein